jgi:hypothetical protein
LGSGQAVEISVTLGRSGGIALQLTLLVATQSELAIALVQEAGFDVTDLNGVDKLLLPIGLGTENNVVPIRSVRPG